MATARPVRIAKPRSPSPGEPTAEGTAGTVEAAGGPGPAHVERRVNVGGSQRALRVTTLYIVALLALYLAFALYDRTTVEGSAAAETNGLLLLTLVFGLFAVAGAVFTLTPAPRSVDVGPDHVIVQGRWGGRRRLPPLALLSMRVARHYSEGMLARVPVDMVEVWGEDTPVRSYLVEAGLFDGAVPTPRGR